MIIDIHTHTFPVRIAEKALRQMQGNCHTALFSDGTEAGLRESERRAGADLAVVQPVATNPDKVAHINDGVLETNRHTAETGILSFGAMHPAYPGWEAELERLKEAGVPGIKLHPPYQKTEMDDPRNIAILRKCRDLGLIVLIHSGLDVGLPGAEETLPVKVRRALDAVGPMKMIAAHMGGWRCWEEARELLKDTGAYLDTSFSLGAMIPAADGHAWEEADLQMLSGEAFLSFVEAFGAERILFGTDSPWAEPTREAEKIRSFDLTPSQLDLIFYRNAGSMLGIT